MLGDEGGGWNPPEPNGSGQPISTAELIFNIFFPAENRAGGDLNCIKSAAGQASADGRNVLTAKHLTPTLVQLLGNIVPNPAMDAGIRAEGRSFLAKKMTLSLQLSRSQRGLTE
jgi:hypothetical protein